MSTIPPATAMRSRLSTGAAPRSCRAAARRHPTASPSSSRPPRPTPWSARLATVGPDTVAKILFTSGSTGAPKGVINTQRMLCSNQEAIGQVWPFLDDEPPVIVDWLPWNHTFGGNHNFNMVLRNGGTLYIDERQAGYRR